MCDYSLQNVASCPAKVGDQLVTTRFTDSITRGFSAVGEPNVAVCLLPGTELAFEKVAEYDHPLAWVPRSRFGKIGQTAARFRQIDTGKCRIRGRQDCFTDAAYPRSARDRAAVARKCARRKEGEGAR